MRLQTIIIGFLVFSLFGIMLINISTDFMSPYNITIDNLTDSGKASQEDFFKSVKKVNNMTDDLNELSGYSPGGGGKVGDDTEETSEDNILIAGFSFITNIGNFLFKYPTELLRSVITFFGLPAIFANIAIASLVIIIVIILISSVLQNRL